MENKELLEKMQLEFKEALEKFVGTKMDSRDAIDQIKSALEGIAKSNGVPVQYVTWCVQRDDADPNRFYFTLKMRDFEWILAISEHIPKALHEKIPEKNFENKELVFSVEQCLTVYETSQTHWTFCSKWTEWRKADNDERRLENWLI